MTTFLTQIFRPSLARRFMIAVREDGWRMALSKARIFAGMLWRGEGQSALKQQPDANNIAPERYLHGIWQQLAQGDAFHPSPAQKTDKPFIAIIGDLNLPQCRKYRVEQLAAFWVAQGVACDFAHYQDLPRVMRLLSRATRLIEYRLQSKPATEMIRYEARRLRLPILYDIDDPLFSVSAYETYGNMAALDPAMKAHFLAEAPKFLAMMNGADMISVSTPGLAQHARLLTGRPVHVRRNFADAATFSDGAKAMMNAPAPDGMFRVAFASGSQGHEVDLETILPAVAAFITADQTRRLILLGHFNIDHLPEDVRAQTDVIPFTTYDRYLAALAQADCAIMPLADDAFNRCKSAVRVIDASCVAVPSIVGTVGDLPVMVRNGETGLIAQSVQDWHNALMRLEGDRTAARKMGQAARDALGAQWDGTPNVHIIAPEITDWVLR